MKSTGKQRGAALGAILLLALLITIPTAAARDGEPLVTSRYLKAQGRDIRLELTIGSPAPATVIVTQHLPADISIEQAQPAVNRFDQRRSEAKWLLSGIDRGRLGIEMRLSRPVRAGELRGQIQYKHPLTGAMVVENIGP
jgi:uncharacterized protein (DUF58 family)